MTFTNEVEKTVYNFIKDSDNKVTFKLLETKLGSNAVGYIGKLNQKELVEIVRELNPVIKKYVKIIKIKGVK